MKRVRFLLVAVSAALSFAVSPADAAYIGNAPWCAVVNVGAGDVEWDCEYGSIEACRPNVIAGNRGFCQINPYYSPVPPPGVPYVKRAHRHGYKY
ncbi:MAG: DUF3551 domain-containing protein [Rhizobiales bacterium]|nr:DUF3551 domain-containing protein [Hyphomicrobiales bacterium]